MGIDTKSENASQMNTIHEEISMQHGLMDLRNLRAQLYAAADHFESSYKNDEHKQFVVDSSKDYVARALVSTVDHLGSVADKFSKFLDEQADEFSATTIRCSCVEQRLKIFQGTVALRGMSQQSLINDVYNPKYHKRYISPAIDKSNISWKYCKSSPEDDKVQTDQESFSPPIQTSRVKPQTPVFRKGHSRTPSYESSPKPLSFSFSRAISNKDAGKRMVSPLRFPLKRSGSSSTDSTSVSPIRSVNQRRWPSQPRGATFGSTKPDPTNNSEIEAYYTKKTKHLFKALLSVHRAKNDTTQNGLYRD